MRKNARLLAASIAALSLFAAACGGDDSGTTTEAPAGSDAPATGIIAGVAFDTGGRGDGTFNDSAATGGERAASELGVEIKELEATVDEDRKANLELLAGDGAQVIVGVGFMFTDPMTEVAAANPDVSFGIVDGFIDSACGAEVTLTNVSCLGFAEQEGADRATRRGAGFAGRRALGPGEFLPRPFQRLRHQHRPGDCLLARPRQHPEPPHRGPGLFARRPPLCRARCLRR